MTAQRDVKVSRARAWGVCPFCPDRTIKGTKIAKLPGRAWGTRAMRGRVKTAAMRRPQPCTDPEPREDRGLSRGRRPCNARARATPIWPGSTRYRKDLEDFDAALDELRHEFDAMREQIVALSQANAELTRKVDVLMRLAALAPRERKVQ